MRHSIETLATVFRRAIEVSDVRSDIGFRVFPRGACGDSSLLLSEFLRKHGYDNIEYVCGWDSRDPDSPRSHAWLEVDGVIVDVTADQFPDRPAPPIFVTRDSEWHAPFREWQRHAARIDGFDVGTRVRLRTLYGQVLEQIPKSLGGRLPSG